MDPVGIIGILLGIVVLYFGVAEGGGLGVFLNFNAALIVLGGTLAATMIGTPKQHFFKAFKEIFALFSVKDKTTPADTVHMMINLSRKAHKYGLGALQSEGRKHNNPFLERAMKLALSGMEGEFIRRILEKEIIESREGQTEAANMFRTMGMFAPMFGLIGTIVGIIRLLEQLSNVEAIGPSMAVAIVTTFYGIFLSNLIFIPVSSKLRLKTQEDTLKKEMIMEGVLSIRNGDIPYMIKHHLQSFLDKQIGSRLEK
jgi:chemotaxis protein MotA